MMVNIKQTIPADTKQKKFRSTGGQEGLEQIWKVKCELCPVVGGRLGWETDTTSEIAVQKCLKNNPAAQRSRTLVETNT